MTEEEMVLVHAGVKGMKWGVRKDAVKLSRKEQSARDQRADYKNRRRTISDKSLDSMVKRLEQEKKLRSLVNEDLSPGKAFVANTIQQGGSKIAGAVAAGTAMYVVRGVLTKDWSLKELAANIPRIKK